MTKSILGGVIFLLFALALLFVPFISPQNETSSAAADPGGEGKRDRYARSSTRKGSARSSARTVGGCQSSNCGR